MSGRNHATNGPNVDADYRNLLKRALLTVEELQARLAAHEDARPEPIAVVGVGARFPGGVSDPDAYWQLLREGRDAISEVPPDRWDVDAFYDADPDAPGKTYARHGGFLDGVDRFDPGFFNISPREAVSMDPQQRLLLEVTWEALEHAGIAPTDVNGTKTGVFVGICGSDYQALRAQHGGTESIDTYYATGVSRSIASGRISYFLGSHGPSVALDTACSSSLFAVHLACQSLRAKESTMALAAGVNLILAPEGFIATSRGQMLSPDGRCKAFDARADGYARSEGCGVVVLKQLRDALADGDRILAVIRGTASNQDGRSNGITAPNGRAQEDVVRSALADAGVAPHEVSYVEAHGTGTSLGDPIEVQALAKVLGEGRRSESPVLIGSVKTNIGHPEAAAGMAGLIKVVLALQHGEIPPHVHLGEPNPLIPWDALPVRVPTELTPWDAEEGQPRTAGLSSFGFSGTNVHLIVEQAPDRSFAASSTESALHVLPLSAKSERALDDLAGRYAEHLGRSGDELADVCFTAATGRTHFPHRLAVIAGTREEMRQNLLAVRRGEEPLGAVRDLALRQRAQKVAFLFTGQGSQYAGMGRELYEREPAFREAIDRCTAVADPLLGRPLLDIIFASGDEGSVHQTAYTQPALFALEWSLARLWQSWGVRPSAVLGHSVGEFVAACVAGVIGMEDGVRLVIERGRLMQQLPEGGAMLAVEATEREAREAIEREARGPRASVSIAAVNGPTSVVLSGAAAGVAAVGAAFEQAGRQVKRLEVSHAFHSVLMEPMLESFAEVAASISYRRPRVKLISNVTGEEVQEAPTAAYWVRHVREAVRFEQGMRTLWEQGYHVFVEAGPHPVLIGMGRGALDPTGEERWVPSLRRGRDERKQMSEAAAMLYSAGVDLEWGALQRRGRRVALPTYPFQRQRYWIDTSQKLSLHYSGTGGREAHPLLGHAVRSPFTDGRVFEVQLGCHVPAYLNDHRIYGAPLLPATAYLEIGHAAARQGFGDNCFHVRDLTFHSALVLPEEGVRTVQVAASKGEGTIQIVSLNEDGETWRKHAEGRIEQDAGANTAPAPVDVTALRERMAEREDVQAYYRMLAEAGAQYGTAFQAIAEVRRGDGEALGRLAVTEATTLERYGVHPVLLDACFQLIGAALPPLSGRDKVPAEVGRLTVYRPGVSEAWCHVVLDEGHPEAVSASMTLFDVEGAVIAEVEGLRLKTVSPQDMGLQDEANPSNWLYETVWRPEPRDPAAPPTFEESGLWLILADGQGIGEALAENLSAEGNTCVCVYPGEYQQGEGAAWWIDPTQRGDYNRLLKDLSAVSEKALQGVVHLWSLDAEADESDTLKVEQLTHLQSALHIVQALAGVDSPPRLWFVTRGAQRVEGDVAEPAILQAPLWGLARTIASELPEFQCARVDLGPSPEVDGSEALFESVWEADGEEEVAFRDGQRYASRLERSRLALDAAAWPWSEGRPFTLGIKAKGSLENLAFMPGARVAPGPGEVTVRVRATGLNFRDVLNALGMYPGDAGPLGNEGAGVVVAVGEGVTKVQPGDAVLFLGSAAFSTYVTTDARLVARKPSGLTFEEAATVPIAFLTAYRGLFGIARLRRGQRVLIHSAAGGVGMAALALARRAGAEVLATAGSPRKRTFLRRLGIAHVFDSRSTAFAEGVRAATGGRGVDVVLNALTGDSIAAGLSVVAEGGHFLEIGKRELWTDEQVAAVNAHARYAAYDLAELMALDPAALEAMLSELVAAFEASNGTAPLRPLPLRTFPVARASEAFAYMARALHVGKVVVAQHAPGDASAGTASDTSREVADSASWVHRDGAYLVTGGLGGLGLATAQFLAARGAGRVVLLSRRGAAAEADPAVAAALEVLRESGAEVEVVGGDVADLDSVARAVSVAELGGLRLRGVVHAAGVLADATIVQQEWEAYASVLGPKAGGAWALEAAVRGRRLDFFVGYSSGSALLGAAGQGAYASANAFLDAVAARRRASGAAGLSVQWGPWADVGMAAEMETSHQARLAGRGMGFIPPEAGLRVLEALIEAGPSAPAEVAVLPIDWARAADAAGPQVPSILSELIQRATINTSNDIALPDLGDLDPEERCNVLTRVMHAHVAKVLRLPKEHVNTAESLISYGMDSLMATEFRNQVEFSFGVAPSITELLTGTSLEEMARALSGQIEEQQEDHCAEDVGREEVVI